MTKVSLIVLVLALSGVTPTLAQSISLDASVSVSVSAEASVSTPEVSTPDLSSALSSASNEVSSAVSSVLSSELSSEVSSSLDSSSGEGGSCSDLDIAGMVLTPIDEAALAAVTSVTVLDVEDCSGLADLATLDPTALAALSGNAQVAAALQAQGEASAEIVAYSLDGASLTVYVRNPS